MSMIPIADTRLTPQEIEAATRVLRSGALRQGPECEGLEKEFCARTGAPHGVVSSNGSTALHLAYTTFLQPGDEVLVPAFTFIATASMVAVAGGTPVFVDVHRETFLMDMTDAERKITPKTKAISPVHLFGNVCDVDQVMSFAARHKLKVVWDAAQAHMAQWKGKDVGGFGDFVGYSFYPTKNMFTGEGGITLTPHAAAAQAMRDYRSHGQTGPYYHTSIGHNFRMTDVEAAIGREMLKRLDAMNAARQRNAAILNETLNKLPGISPQQPTAGATHVWHQYCAVVEPEAFGMNRDELGAKLKEKGVTTGVHYPRGLHQQPAFEKTAGKLSLPGTEYLAQRIIALPVHHGLSEQEAQQVAKAVAACRP
ncbi:MAG: DegT/DnrJ/EryC1/StrS family aminotransferase [Deltaproteobacteria bacterium]|nr:DegT/DnrJ/EryC1/StrS family aminotransferase [Deltaproteobacteria bacterium]